MSAMSFTEQVDTFVEEVLRHGRFAMENGWAQEWLSMDPPISREGIASALLLHHRLGGHTTSPEPPEQPARFTNCTKMLPSGRALCDVDPNAGCCKRAAG